ncbi:MAG TPA: class I SAM-dependent methyltransferase [Roseomonas sp.]|nr:class I SAM-dependent methyltransferase [Roseomonas sp.]
MNGPLSRALDPVIAAILLAPAWLMQRARKHGLEKLPVTQRALLGVGVLPIRDHYYEPQFRPGDLTPERLSQERILPGIDMRLDAEKELLRRFRFQAELSHLPFSQPEGRDDVYWFDNTYFQRMDGSIWYSMLRLLKPRQIIEVGSGFSTLLARHALERNATEPGGHLAQHLCIEPYERPWLERSGAEIVRKRVEEVDLAIFDGLSEGDVLFIDSSHVLRPGGDVAMEILQILPRLKPGVVVHVHDIFTPRDYPWEWLFQMQRLWNEQYALEAFLTLNPAFEVMLGVQYVWHAAREEVEAACVPLEGQIPGTSFYIRRVR